MQRRAAGGGRARPAERGLLSGHAPKAPYPWAALLQLLFSLFLRGPPGPSLPITMPFTAKAVSFGFQGFPSCNGAMSSMGIQRTQVACQSS